MSDRKQYVVMPKIGLRAQASSRSSLALARLSEASARPATLGTLSGQSTLRLLDSRHAQGIKLVEMSAPEARAMAEQERDLIVAPVRYYALPRAPLMKPRGPTSLSLLSSRAKQTVQVVDAQNGKPIKGATVYAFQDFDQRVGASGDTNAQGKAPLALARPWRYCKLSHRWLVIGAHISAMWC